MDINGDTLPVRVDTNVNYEKPEIQDGTSTRPAPMPLVLTITISHLQPGVEYNLYRYNAFASVPNEQFNAHASSASQSWKIEIAAGDRYVMTQEISSDEIAIYRAVKASAL